MKPRLYYPSNTLSELRQCKLLLDKLGLLAEFTPELIGLYDKTKNIVGDAKLVKRMSDGDYESQVIFFLIYWRIVRTYPCAIIKRVKQFFMQFYNKNNISSLDLLDTQRGYNAVSFKNGVNAMVKDYAVVQRSRFEYWQDIMVYVFGIWQRESYQPTSSGNEVLSEVESSEPVLLINKAIYTETDLCNALLGMLAVEFMAIAVSEIMINSNKINQSLSVSPSGTTCFDMHYYSADKYCLNQDKIKIDEFHLPYALINCNMARLAYVDIGRHLDFNKYATNYIINIVNLFLTAADYNYQISAMLLQSEIYTNYWENTNS